MALGLSPTEIVEKGVYQLLTAAPHWERVSLSEVADVQNGFAFKSDLFDRDDGVPLIRIRDIANTTTEHKYVGDYDPVYLVHRGDILIGMDGDFTAARWKGGEALLNQRVCRLTVTSEHLDERFFFLCLQPYLDAINAETSSVTVKHLSSRTVEAIPLPLPPLAEQRRIVAKLDELFSELDKGVESLQTARAQLEAYRHALLASAFKGCLTAGWRNNAPERVPTPDQLLDDVAAEHDAYETARLSAWKEEVKAWRANGENGSKPSKPRSSKTSVQPSPEELDLLDPLPKGYAYTYLANLGELARGRSRHRPRNAPELFGGPYPFIQTGEVRAANRVVREYSQTYSEVGLDQSRLWPKGTLCITIAANIAETAFLGFDACFPDSVVGFTANEALVLPEYIELFIKSVQARIDSYAPATAQKNINLRTLENLIVPLCSLEEQRLIVDRLGSALSVVRQLEAETDAALARTRGLRQAILKRAFAGELVPQGPADEPASVLLERIREQRDGRGSNKKRKAAS